MLASFDLIGWLQHLDENAFLALNRALHAFDGPNVRALMRLGREGGNGWIALPLVLGLLFLSHPERRHPRFFEALVSLSVVGLLIHVLKNAVDRLRPTAALADAFADERAQAAFGENAHVASFPSGHAATAFTVAMLLAIWARALPARWSRIGAIVAVMLLATLTGASRIYAGIHYPGDVLAGALLGISVVLLVHAVAKRIFTHRSGRDAPPRSTEPGNSASQL